MSAPSHSKAYTSRLSVPPTSNGLAVVILLFILALRLRVAVTMTLPTISDTPNGVCAHQVVGTWVREAQWRTGAFVGCDNCPDNYHARDHALPT